MTTTLTPHPAPQVVAPPAWDRILGDITRRRFLIGTVGIAGLTLTSCSDGSRDDLSSPGSRALRDEFGSVNAPTSPQRVVFADIITLSNALSLGFDVDRVAGAGIGGPAGVEYARPIFAAGSLPDPAEFTDVGGFFETNLEALASAEPDLVVMVGRPTEEFRAVRDQLASVGSTVYVAPNDSTSLDSSLAILTAVGDVLGIDGAASLAAEFLAQVRDFAQRPELPSVSLLNFGFLGSGSVQIYEGAVLRDLGISTWVQPNVEVTSIELSPEQLDSASGDVVLVQCPTGVVDDARRQLEANPLWASLPAVRSGNVTFTDFPLLEYSLAALEESFSIISTAIDGFVS
jgi:iron complex transport system substrate-binding protein